MNTGTSDGTSNVFETLQDLQLKQYQYQYHSNTVPSTSKMFHTTNIAQMAQPVASFRTTTPSAPARTDTTTTKQVNPVNVPKQTSHKAPLAHCAHVNELTIQVCKPGEPLALRKVKHPQNGRTSVNRLPLMKQDILSQYSGCFEGIVRFPGDQYKFHLKPEQKPA